MAAFVGGATTHECGGLVCAGVLHIVDVLLVWGLKRACGPHATGWRVAGAGAQHAEAEDTPLETKPSSDSKWGIPCRSPRFLFMVPDTYAS